MPVAARKEAPLIDDDKPEASVGNIIDAIRQFGDRAVLLRRLETEDAAAKEKFDAREKPYWDALAELRKRFVTSPADASDMALLEGAIETWRKRADASRATHDAILEAMRGLIPVVVKKTGQPRDWVTLALEFATRPARRTAQNALDYLFELEMLAADVDPDAGPAGDVIQDGDDVAAWSRRALAGE